MGKSIQFLIFVLFICAVNSAKILGVFHIPAYSHYQLGDKLLKELAARGHEVTVITPYEEKTPVKNFKQVLLTGAIEKLKPMKSKLFEQTQSNLIRSVLWLDAIGLQLTEDALNHTNVQQFLKSKQEFDLVILNQFVNEAFKGFCHHFNAPCIVLCPLPVPYWTHPQIGNPDSPAYIPDMYSDPGFDTSFTQRFCNSIIYVGLRLFNYFYALPRQNELMHKYFPNAPDLNELYYNTSLVLVNSHISINPATPNLPNLIDIGGFHVKPPKKLPEDLQKYLNSAKNGVILFSMGSNLQSKDLPTEKRECILKAFSKLKQDVLWKWEEETLPNQPSNVKLSKWLPQSDIIAHPNIKLFITHGGLLSTTEAIYHGVPIIGIPVLADQLKNAATAERDGYGIAIPFRELTEEKLTHALKEVLNNPKYKENVKARSEIMHGDPMKQIDKAVFWTEYVIRHKGAPHLRSAALNLSCAKILGVFHVPAYSHYQLGDRLLKELAARGHEVTVITPFEEKTPVKNFKQVLLTGSIEKLKPIMKSKLFEQTESNLIHTVLLWDAVALQLTEDALNNTNVQQFLRSNQEFDLVILHQSLNEAFKAFCHHFNAPCVVLCPIAAPHWTHPQIGNPDSPAYIPDIYSDPEFNTGFIQRFWNCIIYIGLRLFNQFYALPRQNELMHKYFPNAPDLNELYYNTSLVLVNSHISINPATPNLPNLIDIGGFHVKPPKKLPEDLQKYLDSAKNGVILFSMGSNLQSKDMPTEKRDCILKAFSKLKQNVLWKWEEETLPNQPSNVKISKWLPQSDIIAHPNIKLFITHGGLLSTTEAVYHGVPIIGIPVLGDQHKNAAIAQRGGYGISIPFKELTEEKLTKALNKVLNNPKYRENIKARSEIMHADPIKQIDKAVFWTEYVIRHKGAPHLRSAALNLSWYQYLLLDVVAAVILIIFVPLFVIIKALKKCCQNSEKSVTKCIVSTDIQRQAFKGQAWIILTRSVKSEDILQDSIAMHDRFKNTISADQYKSFSLVFTRKTLRAIRRKNWECSCADTSGSIDVEHKCANRRFCGLQQSQIQGKHQGNIRNKQIPGKAIFWTEYFIRHSTPHLRSADGINICY
ncbi:hypothetical protein ILUMI_00537 [Ignelater luminosus]|uniref:UDP-glycosyltransferase n=1 Tax=Ignelater luminosus TaxID=2038154 RepID=A0A8K0DSF7_IGNLU|nr:hypothetical protein ILUMI_00537 [Ignelater luminosus]